jgi:hypothetical protein
MWIPPPTCSNLARRLPPLSPLLLILFLRLRPRDSVPRANPLFVRTLAAREIMFAAIARCDLHVHAVITLIGKRQ